MVALIIAAVLAAGPARLDPDVLRARYAGIHSLDADVVQRKEGRFWARPFESQIRLRYTPDRIVWETLSPVHSTVTIESKRLAITDASGNSRELGAAAGDPRVVALLGFFRALITVDLESLNRDFAIQYGEGELVATPRQGEKARLFESIRLQFNARYDLVAMELVTKTERTHLTFRALERVPPLANGGAGAPP
jgi:hypothetical protein